MHEITNHRHFLSHCCLRLLLASSVKNSGKANTLTRALRPVNRGVLFLFCDFFASLRLCAMQFILYSAASFAALRDAIIFTNAQKSSTIATSYRIAPFAFFLRAQLYARTRPANRGLLFFFCPFFASLRDAIHFAFLCELCAFA